MSAPARITYAGHATVLLELAGVRLLTDPVLRPRIVGLIHRHAAAPSAEVFERIDGALVSHLHHDHLDFPTLRRLGEAVPVVVGAGGARTIRRRGFANVVELRAGERTRIGAAEIAATPAVHEGRRYKLGPAVDAVGYEITAAGQRIYFAGDTDLFDEMSELEGGLDVALLPIAGWGHRVGKGHLDPRRAAEAAARLRPRFAIPIHWGTLLRSDLRRRAAHFLSEPPRRFVAQLAELAPEVEPVVLDPGESFELPLDGR